MTDLFIENHDSDVQKVTETLSNLREAMMVSYDDVEKLKSLSDTTLETIFDLEWAHERNLVECFQELQDHLRQEDDEQGLEFLERLAFTVSSNHFRHDKAQLHSDCLDFDRRIPFAEDQTEAQKFWEAYCARTRA